MHTLTEIMPVHCICISQTRVQEKMLNVSCLSSFVVVVLGWAGISLFTTVSFTVQVPVVCPGCCPALFVFGLMFCVLASATQTHFL